MKKKICTIHILVVLGSLLIYFNSAFAVDLDFQPRIEAGVMSYSFEQSSHGVTVPTGMDDTSGFNQTREEIEFKATMGFVSGGATLFYNRLFVDLSGQYTLEGSDRMAVSESIYNEADENSFGLSTYTTVEAGYDAQLERSDHAIAVGYAVTRRLSLFAGYKWAVVDLDTTIDGPFSLLVINNAVFNGQITGDENVEFKYEGPFVGLTHGWQIDGSSIFQGLVSINAGLAHLNSKLVRRRTINLRVESMNGQDVETPETLQMNLAEEIEGDTLGFTFGMSWRGLTPVENLTYSLGINGYRYQFDSDDSISPDISETAVSLKVGLVYLF